MLYTSQVLEVVKNAKKIDIFSLVSSNLMPIYRPNVGHQEKYNIQILNYNYSAKQFKYKSRGCYFLIFQQKWEAKKFA